MTEYASLTPVYWPLKAVRDDRTGLIARQLAAKAIHAASALRP